MLLTGRGIRNQAVAHSIIDRGKGAGFSKEYIGSAELSVEHSLESVHGRSRGVQAISLPIFFAELGKKIGQENIYIGIG